MTTLPYVADPWDERREAPLAPDVERAENAARRLRPPWYLGPGIGRARWNGLIYLSGNSFFSYGRPGSDRSYQADVAQFAPCNGSGIAVWANLPPAAA